MIRLAACVAAFAALSASSALAVAPALTPADQAAAFRAAGFTHKGKAWVRCDDSVTVSHQTGSIEAADLNGDGLPEAWITESSTYCYGDTAEAFVLVTKKPAGWVVLLDGVGMADTHKTTHLGWPDIEIGGPGMGPFPVYRFNGVKYVASR